jgi:hypothetical protein
MPVVSLQIEVDEETLQRVIQQIAGVRVPTTGERAKAPVRRASKMKFNEGSPEWEGNYARLWKDGLRPDLWEMIYAAAETFGTEPFTLEQLAAALGVEAEDVRKRMRALGRSRVVSEILKAIGGLGVEGNTREDALPWMRFRQPDGSWTYRLWGWQDQVSHADRILAEGR